MGRGDQLPPGEGEPEVSVTYTVFKLGPTAQLHQLHTAQGRVFIAGEVAASLFALSPTAFLQELRQGKYPRLLLTDPAALRTVAALGLPVEASAGAAGAAALPPGAVQQLMIDRRRLDLLQPFKLALLKLASQEAARLMAEGAYEAALPVALDAVKQGEALFKPGPALQMFPLYLLAAQANLGLRRAQQCSDALCLAGLLALKEPGLTTSLMRAQLARLNGQLAALQGRAAEACGHFGQDVYYCSLEYGARDVRTSLGYFNLGKVLQQSGNEQGALACGDTVVGIWLAALVPRVLGEEHAAALGSDDGGGGGSGGSGEGRLPVGPLQLLEVVDMLQDISKSRAAARGEGHCSVGKALLAAALALVYVGEGGRARELLDRADVLLPLADAPRRSLLDAALAAADAAAAAEAAAAGGARGWLGTSSGSGWLGRASLGASTSVLAS